nr:MAG: hypothetical protein [Totiviridae sp.]
MSFDISDECVLRGGRQTEGWYAVAGDKKYDTVIVDGKPFLYIPYGVTVINFMLQHQPFEITEPMLICFELRSGNNVMTVVTNVAEDVPQPEFDFDIPHIIPGTLLTWDHAEDQQMVPILYSENMPNHMFAIMSSVKVMKSAYAGINYERSVTAPITVDFNKVDDMFKNMDIFANPIKGGKKDLKFAKQEN